MDARPRRVSIAFAESLGVKGRLIDVLALVAGIAALTAIGMSKGTASVSTYSTYDTGPNGYRALYDVLARENVPVTRFRKPVGELPKSVRVFAITSTIPEVRFGQRFASYSRGDIDRLKDFAKRGGRVVLFVSRDSQFAKLFDGRASVFDVSAYTNAALERHPRSALAIYRLVAGRGPVAFDERIHGYAQTRSLWSVLPGPARAAAWVALFAVLLGLVEANVRWVPPAPRGAPEDRDSSAYIASMASLLRRARAPHSSADMRKEHG
jgi:hypothetical protein